jgi:hypothetical protein
MSTSDRQMVVLPQARVESGFGDETTHDSYLARQPSSGVTSDTFIAAVRNISATI